MMALDLGKREAGRVYPSWTQNAAIRRRLAIERMLIGERVELDDVVIVRDASAFASDVYRVLERGAEIFKVRANQGFTPHRKKAIDEIMAFLSEREKEDEMGNEISEKGLEVMNTLYDLQKRDGEPVSLPIQNILKKSLIGKGLIMDAGDGLVSLTAKGSMALGRTYPAVDPADYVEMGSTSEKPDGWSVTLTVTDEDGREVEREVPIIQYEPLSTDCGECADCLHREVLEMLMARIPQIRAIYERRVQLRTEFDELMQKLGPTGS